MSSISSHKLFLRSCILIYFLAGCTTPEPIDRQGMIDSWGSAEQFDTQSRLLRHFKWPVEPPVVTSGFGRRGGRFHDGVDLRASVGTSVRAAADGEVIYAASTIRGYGRLIIIRHAGDILTLYAHNSKFRVKVGDRVRRNQLIALSGRSGHAKGPHVHFEIRKGVLALNPEKFIPKMGVATASYSSKKR